MPFLAIGGFALAQIGGSSTPSGPPGPVVTSAPPNIAAEAAPCAKVIEQLPVQLGKLNPRVVHTTPDTPYVVAWGNPAVVLACGVARPAVLHPNSSALFVLGGNQTGPYYNVTSSDGADVWTTVDREAYVSITVPNAYQGGDILPPLSRAIAKALPAVCSAGPGAKVARSMLCDRRP